MLLTVCQQCHLTRSLSETEFLWVGDDMLSKKVLCSPRLRSTLVLLKPSSSHMTISFSWRPARQPSLPVIEIAVHQKAVQQRLCCYFLWCSLELPKCLCKSGLSLLLELLLWKSASLGLTCVRTVGVTLARKWERPGHCFSGLLSHCSLAWAPGSRAPTMAFPNRVHHPSVIPKKEEIPQSALSSVCQANGNEDERAVSKLQRRQSDVKVYKEFCDFYAKLWVSPFPEFLLPDVSAWALSRGCQGGAAGSSRQLGCLVMYTSAGWSADMKENATVKVRVVIALSSAGSW